MFNLLKRLLLVVYNKRHQTNICSIRASKKAKYDKGVTISENTYVSSDVVIGKHSYVNRNSSIEKCIIGNYCSISSGVYICPFEHHIELFSSHPFASKGMVDKRKTVIIGNDVLISLNVIVLNGVSIGNGAVIGAGAVVTKDVLSYEIVAGVPAKHIGWRFPEDVRTIIENSKWYEKDIDQIEQELLPELKLRTEFSNYDFKKSI